MPKASSSPAIVPTNASCGRSGSTGLGGAGGGTYGATTGGGGGRREGEKIGRSRVIDKSLIGIAQSGFPLVARSSTPRAADGPPPLPASTDMVSTGSATAVEPIATAATIPSTIDPMADAGLSLDTIISHLAIDRRLKA